MATSAVLDVRASAAEGRSPDPEWRGLYRAGGICAGLYVLFALVVPTAMTAAVDDFWNLLVDAPRLLDFIADNPVSWHVMQALVLQSSILMIVAFVALAVALKHLDRVWATIGAVVSVTVQVLFMAYYPVLLGLAYLGDQYGTATADRQAELVTAAEALIAQNSGFNPAYEALMGVGILIFSIVMLKGTFPRWVAVLGIVTFAASIVSLSLYPIIGLNYLLWWVAFMVWFPAVGWKLYALGRRHTQAT